MPEHEARGKSSWLSRTIIGLNNWRKSKQSILVRPEHVLLLLPRCLQFSDCAQNIAKDITYCKRCGRCKIKNVIELAEELGVVPFVATGGRIAVAKVLEGWVEAVVAIACEAELKAGIIASPKPVIAIVNHRPNGPCFETDVDLDEVRDAIFRLIGGKRI